MNAPNDPFKGMTYTAVLAKLPPDQRHKYYERPHPITSRIPVGITVWDASIGRHVTVR